MTGITPSLFLFTLIAVLAIAVVAYVLFLRKRSNRKPVEKPELESRSMAPTAKDHRT
jgi:Na+/H+ antiporter NhaD/arsenite permease-like protein